MLDYFAYENKPEAISYDLVKDLSWGNVWMDSCKWVGRDVKIVCAHWSVENMTAVEEN